MEVVESLIQGVPQSVYDGAVLIALSSWHLYPDMVIFHDGFKEITQSDPLISQGGVLTVGLKASPDNTEGVRWSLPLSRLRYYGAPVWTTHSLESRNSRVLFRELVLVALGSLSHTWPDEIGVDDEGNFDKICNYYVSLWEWFSDIQESKGLPSWLSYIPEGANDFLSARGDKRRSMLRLMGFGYRRCDKFIGSQLCYQSQIWNMEDPTQFMLKLLPERRIEYLRRLAATANPEQKDPGD